MHTAITFLPYLTLLPLFYSPAFAHPSSQEPLTITLEDPFPTDEKCLSYSATFLTPYAEGALEPHATAQLPGFCEGTTEKVALHPNIVDDFGWVMDFSGSCGCDGMGGDGSERFWVYFPIEVVEETKKDSSTFESPSHYTGKKEKSKKRQCHEKQKEKQMQVEITEPWILHAEGCESNRGDPEINEGLGTCEEGTLKMWKMGVEMEDWRELREDGGMVWVVEGWDWCEELEGRLAVADEDEDVQLAIEESESDEEEEVEIMLDLEL